jgi:hypothetical protein
VVVISFEPLEQLRNFADEESLPFLILSDTKCEAYRAFGLQEGPMHRLLGLATIRAYVQGLFQGRRPKMPRANTRQLGGDIVINASGKVVFLYKSKSPADRPVVGVLLDALRRSVRESCTNGEE